MPTYTRWTPLVAAGLLLTACGCASPNGKAPPLVRTLTQQELNAFYDNARDPRRFSFMVYPSPDGPIYSGANRLHPGQDVTLPFASPRKTSLPMIDVRARGGDKFPALLDTTSRRTWVGPATALDTKISPLFPDAHQALPAHVKDTVPGYACAYNTLRMGAVRVESAVVYMRGAHGALGPLARGVEHPAPKLVIGTDLLRTFEYVQFDFAGREVRFSTLSTYSPDEEDLIAIVPFSFIDGALAVNGAMDGKPMSILLDIAGDFEAAVPQPAPATITQLSLGDLVFRGVASSGTEELGLGFENVPRVGRALLQKYKIALDNTRKVLYFERPSG